MRLYHHPFSFNARRAVMTALHLGADVELVFVDLAKERGELPHLNPNNKVPVLVDGDFVLWESYAIMEYLAEGTPGQKLLPSDRRARADVHKWMYWGASHWSPMIGIFNWENCIKGMIGLGGPDERELARGNELAEEYAPVLDEHLAGREWVSGRGLTLADFALASPLMALHPAKVPLQKYGNIMSWFARIQELDAWKKTSL